MKIIPIAADSMGTRSMATLVETNDLKILIDPAVALGPLRYNLPPHPLEFQKMEKDWDEIKKHAQKSDVLIVTHYHYDHHDPSEPEIYRGKIALLKHPRDKINLSQKQRAKFFLERLKDMPKKIEFSDGMKFQFGATEIKFSQGVFHGASSKLGYVTELIIREDSDSFLFTSDVQGFVVREQASFVLEQKPRIIYADGPLSYMLGFRFSQENLNAAIANMVKIISETHVEKFILDHHFLRDLKWRERIHEVFKAAKKRGIEILTAAEFAGRKIEMLEARRRELFREFPAAAMQKVDKVLE